MAVWQAEYRRVDGQDATRYEIVTDEATGISIEFRQWGDPDSDQTRMIIEANYGFAKGEAAAINRLVSA